MKRTILIFLSTIVVLFITGFELVKDRTAIAPAGDNAGLILTEKAGNILVQQQPKRKARYTGISATDAREMAQHYSDRNKDLAHYLGSTNASSATPWSKEELLEMVQDDAQANTGLILAKKGSMLPAQQLYPKRKNHYTGVSAADAQEMARNYSDRNKDIAHYLDSTYASSAAPWSKEELLKMLHDDAQAVWYSMEELESYIQALKQQAAGYRSAPLGLGIRIYFGRYSANVSGIPASYINRKTVFLVPTYDSVVAGENGYETVPVDFNPWLNQLPEQVATGFTTSNQVTQEEERQTGVWVMPNDKPGPVSPAAKRNRQYRLSCTAKMPPDSAVNYIMNHSQIPPGSKPGGGKFYQR